MHVLLLEGASPTSTIQQIWLGGQTPDASGSLQPAAPVTTTLAGLTGQGQGVPDSFVRFVWDLAPLTAALLLCSNRLL